MKEGWDAKGRLEPLWKDLDPPVADTLAALAGVHVKTLYSANAGSKPLGLTAGRKIADARGRTIYDLGAPMPIEEAFTTSLLGRIVRELERNPPAGNSPHLLRLADALREVADRLEAVAAAGRDAERLPG